MWPCKSFTFAGDVFVVGVVKSSTPVFGFAAMFGIPLNSGIVMGLA